MHPPSVSLVTEAYNLAEGQSEASFVRAVCALQAIRASRPNLEVLVLDPTPVGVAGQVLAAHCPGLTTLHVPGLTYDGQKNAAARVAKGEFLVFLDGDCVPQSSGWLNEILAPFHDEHVHAVGGLTIYEGDDLTSKAMTILDFGFLFEPDVHGHIGCYASNNVAFRRSSYLAVMAPDDGVMRSYCYKHAQLLARAGMPVYACHQAKVLHELPDVQKERWRRGYDHAAACWEDPVLSGARDIELSESFMALVMAEQRSMALDRLSKAPDFLGIAPGQHDALVQEIDRLLAIEREGLRAGLKKGEADGANACARSAHAAIATAAQRGRRRSIRRWLARWRGNSV